MTDPIEYEMKSDGTQRLTKGGKKIHKVKVPAVWVWGDQLIKARPEDTKAHNLVVNRPVVLPKAKPKASASKPKRVSARIAAQKASASKPIASAASASKKRLYVNQDVVTTVGGKRVHAQNRNEVEVDYYWPADNDL